MNPYPYIIEQNARRRVAIRVIEGVVTILLWLGYLYLMRHALSVSLSYFGIAAPWGLQYDDVSVPPLLSDLRSYAAIVLVNAVVFILWAVYNKLMFGYRNRRRKSEIPSPAQIAAFFSISEEQVEASRAARRMVMHHDPQGHLAEIAKEAEHSADLPAK